MSKKDKKVSIGGQALMEGVMVRGKTSMARAVRDEDGIIREETKRLPPPEKTNFFLRLPIIRGCKAFISSLFGGMECLMRSAEVYGEEEPGKFEKWLSKKFKIDLMKVILGVSLVLALGLAVLLFIFFVSTNSTVLSKHHYLYPLIPLNIKKLSHLIFRRRKRDFDTEKEKQT